ncbi:MAG: M24 family metallopeptidase [Planctomycetes bacterium]|nr:M24 family metallopeptidase [Planctomycetota bacterium]
MSSVLSEQIDPPSSDEITTLDAERTADIEQKHELISEFLQTNGYDALLLTQAAGFAWFTSGGDCSQAGSAEATAALFITPKARVVVTKNVDSARIFDQVLPQLGFQLKERNWTESWELFLKDLCRSRRIAGDNGFGSTHNVSVELSRMRQSFTPLERQRLRSLGRMVAHAVEATARSCRPGRFEAELAGELAHRLIKRQVVPMRIQVAADGKTERYRNGSYGNDRVERFCTISAIGRQHGLCLGAARTVCFGEVPETLENAHRRAALVHAAGMHFSQAGWEIGEVWKRVQRIYEKFGCANEWRLATQAEIIGYDVCEEPVRPESDFRLGDGMAVHWHPSVGPALLGDSVLIGKNSSEILTPMVDWPKFVIEVKGTTVNCPEILRKPRGGEEEEDPLVAETDDSILEFRFDDSFPG